MDIYLLCGLLVVRHGTPDISHISQERHLKARCLLGDLKPENSSHNLKTATLTTSRARLQFAFTPRLTVPVLMGFESIIIFPAKGVDSWPHRFRAQFICNNGTAVLVLHAGRMASGKDNAS